MQYLDRRKDGNKSIPCSLKWRAWYHPPFFEAFVYDGTLYAFYRYWIFYNTKHARALTRSRANSTSELREVVGLK